jgi:hypothetical protein
VDAFLQRETAPSEKKKLKTHQGVAMEAAE